MNACATRPVKPPATKAAKTTADSPVAVTPAKVLMVNSEFRFVVLDFDGRLVPKLGTQLTVRREGKTVGAVRVTGPVSGLSAVADIVEGELRVGDEAR